ncbi:MAG: asparagine synthase [Bacteroidales bacterium]|nr:asparagine synthase [Bacteroidales bacterium]
MRIADKKYCMSSFLMYRTVIDRNRCFVDGIKDFHVYPPKGRTVVYNSNELESALRKEMQRATESGKCALALSGGIDSAILAKMMPKGSVAYTFKCIVPGIEVVDESPVAAKYAEECGLEHRIVEVYWEDMENMSKILMQHKGAPCHSIEVQIYKASVMAKLSGFENIVFGESADIVFGGMSSLLSKNWTIGDFIERYSYVLPYKVLKDPMLIIEPFMECEKDGYADVHRFLNKTMYEEAINSYEDACATAGIKLFMPYSLTELGGELDYTRIRAGENKYLIREIFQRLYPGWEIPVKTPMPRPLNEWMKEWGGPKRNEFWPNCTENMTGDQKWYVYALEKFLNMLDNNEYNK